LWEYNTMMNKYETIFNHAPIGIWEEDWSMVKTILDHLRPTVPPEDILTHFDNNPKCVQQLANAIKVTRISPKAIEMHEGCSETQFVDVSLTDTFSEASYSVFKAEMAALYRGETRFEMEAEKESILGNPVYILLQISFPQSDEDYKSVVVAMIDITPSKIAHKKLEYHVRKYQQLLDSTNTVYIISDEEGEIRDVSKNLMTLFGTDCQVSCLIGKYLRAFVSSESIPAFDSAWKRIIKGQTVNAIEIALAKKDAFKWVSLNASLFCNGGSKVFILLTDITERKRADYEHLIAREKSRDKIRNNIRDIRNAIERIGNK